MKRFLCFLLVLSLVPVLCFSESAYSPGLKMKISEFITKYNAVGSPLGSSLSPLSKPYQTSNIDGFDVFWFNADSKSGVFIFLLSMDPKSNGVSLDAGLDIVQVYLQNEKEFLSFVSVGTKCASLFSADLFGTSMASYYIGSVMSDFYENNAKDSGMYYYREINTDEKWDLALGYADPYYYFTITPGDLL